MNMKLNEFAKLRTAAQDILVGEKAFDEISETVDTVTVVHDNDPWMQARMRMFPAMSAGSHALATYAIDLCERRDDPEVATGDTARDRYLSLVWPTDEEAGDVIPMLRDANPTFRDAMGYCALNKDIRCQIARDDPLPIRKRGKIAPDDMLPIEEFMSTALTNNIYQTWATVLRDMLWVRARTGSLPEPEVLTARAWSRFDMYVHLSNVPGQMFNIAALGREVAKIKKKNIIETNNIQMIGPPTWLDAVDQYIHSGRIPDFAYTMAPSLLLTDEEISPQSRNHGLCAGQTALRAYTTPDIPRPTDRQIRRFFKDTDQRRFRIFRKSSQMAADGSFPSISYHLTRGIQAASQTIFADKDYRQAVDSMVWSLLKSIDRPPYRDPQPVLYSEGWAGFTEKFMQ